MKKAIYTTLVCLLLLAPLTTVVSATSNLLIGKKVQAVIPVTVNGEPVKDAIIIDGITYAPVRSFSEAAGYSISIEGGTVKLADGSQTDSEVVEQIKTTRQINALKKNIVIWQATLDGNMEVVTQTQAAIDEMEAWNKKANADTPKMDASSAQEKLTQAQTEISELQTKIDNAKAEITRLQSLE